MRYLDAEATRQALSMSDAIRAMETAFGDDREVPLRSLLAQSLFMTGRVGPDTGVKVVSTVPGQPHGIVAVFDSDGRCSGIVDGPTLTAIRTGAGAGLATRLLARPDTRTMAMLGSGAMAFDQVMAVREVRPVEDVLVWSRDPDRAAELAKRVGGQSVEDADDAVRVADVVSTATPALEPLFAAESLQPGTHLNAIGAYTPKMCEVPPEVVQAAFTVVDDFAAAEEEAGDILRAGRSPDASMADLLSGRVKGRTGPGQITFFKSVGIASQDVAAAAMALQRAAETDVGVTID